MQSNRDGQHPGPVGAPAGDRPSAPEHPDPIDQAIAAARQAPQARMVVASRTIPATGRQFQVIVPEDFTDLDFIALIGFVTQMRDELAQRQAAGLGGRIVLPPGARPA